VRAADLQATHRDGQRLVAAAEAQIRLAQPDMDPAPQDLHGLRRDTRLEQRQGFGHPSSQDIRIAKGRRADVKQKRMVPDPADLQATFEPRERLVQCAFAEVEIADAMFEPRERLVQCAFAEVEIADAMACRDQAGRVIDGLGNSETFFAMGQPLGEGAQLSETHGQQGTRRHRGQTRQAEMLPEQCPFERHQVLPQEVYGLRIVTQSLVYPAQEEGRHDLECRISQGLSQGEGALPHLDGAWQVACGPKTIGHIGSTPG
jgi:hypothetical protein